MILVDTSIWIDLLSRAPRFRLSADEMARVATCGPILQEVLQGATTPSLRSLHTGLLALPRLDDPLETEVFVEAASIYRTGRAKGLTIRSSVDCLIAAIAIRAGVPVWHDDRDFQAISSFTALQEMRKPGLH